MIQELILWYILGFAAYWVLLFRWNADRWRDKGIANRNLIIWLCFAILGPIYQLITYNNASPIYNLGWYYAFYGGIIMAYLLHRYRFCRSS